MKKFKRQLIYILSSWLAKAFARSYSFEVSGQENLGAKDQACVVAIWHEHLFPVVCSLIGDKQYTTMVSQSEDGNIIANIISQFGFNPVARGSSSRGGGDARDDLMVKMMKGISPVLTVDGPRGPRHKVKGGVIYLARESQTTIVPATVACSSAWIFEKSWDKFCLPRFFSKIKIIYGPPIVISQEAKGKKFAEAKYQVSEALLELNRKHRHD